ncbi:MAG: hypothetical protein ACJ74U_15345 [Jatrophihabitantaceae bacterium]
MTARTAHEMRCRIAARFGSSTTEPRRLVRGPAVAGTPEFLVLFEVPIEGRASRTHLTSGRQRIDAVAYGMWAKTGHAVHGIEIKTSRADLVRELHDRGKADAAVAACDYWWLALGSASLLRDTDQLPEGWGVLAAAGTGLRTLREPTRRAGVRDERFVAGLLLAAMRSSTYRRAQGYQAGLADAQRTHQVELARRTRLYELALGAAVDGRPA